VLQGLYSAAAGMAAQQQRIDALSNDVANVNTAGYKRQRLDFRDLAYQDVPTGNGVRAGAGAAVTSAGRSMVGGSIETTGQALDVAIEGDGFIPVRRADGSTALTRSGALRMNAERQLVTSTGERVMPAITIPQDAALDDVSIANDGTVTALGRPLGRIQLQDVPAPQGLLAAGDNLVVPTEASGAPRNATGSLRQGALERSNVDIAEAMTELMEAQRSYTMASRVIQTQDQLMEIANGVKR
jgi:flagellar basal-body rod protein FlgG